MMENDAKRRLKAAELQAKETRLRMWANYILPATNSKAAHDSKLTKAHCKESSNTSSLAMHVYQAHQLSSAPLAFFVFLLDLCFLHSFESKKWQRRRSPKLLVFGQRLSLFVNGGASSMLATCVTQPIDMIKVRIRLSRFGCKNKPFYRVMAINLMGTKYREQSRDTIFPSLPSACIATH